MLRVVWSMFCVMRYVLCAVFSMFFVLCLVFCALCSEFSVLCSTFCLLLPPPSPSLVLRSRPSCISFKHSKKNKGKLAARLLGQPPNNQSLFFVFSRRFCEHLRVYCTGQYEKCDKGRHVIIIHFLKEYKRNSVIRHVGP